jgi:TRAP-type C4-dicarboxylate transport system substrate-binding protein
LIKQKEKELDQNRKIASGVIELIKNSTLKIRSFNPSLEVTNSPVLFLNKLESPCYYISALLRTFALRLSR